jgi:hypothetical protein
MTAIRVTERNRADFERLYREKTALKDTDKIR